jgi:cobaltochelatase CobN
MISDDLLYDVSHVIGYTEYPEPAKDLEKENELENCTELLLRAVIFNNTSPEKAQENVLGPGNVSSNVTADLETAMGYAEAISNCTIEIPRVLDGLSGRYVPPKVGNDPIRNPDALPTGNNFYSFEAMRHEGITESEALYLLGVKPVWKKGKVKDVDLIQSSELGRPRIDVLLASSGLYRDTFPDKIELLDKAVRLAAQAEDDVYPNYVKENTEAIYEWLIAIHRHRGITVPGLRMQLAPAIHGRMKQNSQTST